MRFGSALIFLGFSWLGLAQPEKRFLDEDYLVAHRPHSGEKVLRGKPYTFIWNPVHTIAKVNLTLFHGGFVENSGEIETDVYSIATEIDNTGKFKWLVPEDLPSSYVYRYRIVDSTDIELESREISHPFTILKEGEELNEAGVAEGRDGLSGIEDRFVHPQSSDDIVSGEPFDIVWIPLANVSQVALVVGYNNYELTIYQHNTGEVNMVIATNVTNNGKYTWDVPSGLADEVKSKNAGDVTVIALVPSYVDDLFDQDDWWWSYSPHFVTPAEAKKYEQEEEAEESALFSSSFSSVFTPTSAYTGDFTKLTAESKPADLASTFDSSFSGLNASSTSTEPSAVTTKSSSSARVRDSIESTTTSKNQATPSQSSVASTSSRVSEPSGSVASAKPTETTSASTDSANGAVLTSISLGATLFAIMAGIF